VQVELGLKSAEEVAERRRQLPKTPLSFAAPTPAQSLISSKTRHERTAVQRKAKNKMAKQSRKKNRKAKSRHW
jgi:hypothetical protein